MTPIATSLQIITNILKNSAGKFHIYLITDGLESCGGDPSAEIQKLQNLTNIKVTNISMEIVIAGIDMSATEEKELGDIAKVGKAEYRSIKSREGLKKNFRNSAVYHDLSLEEFNDLIYIKNKDRCNNTSVPFEIIGRCNKNYVTILLNTKRQKDIYNFYILNHPSVHARYKAYHYFKFSCKPKIRAVDELLQKRYNTLKTGFEKMRIKEVIDRMDNCG